MATIVLDPGHGGNKDLLGSSANRARGPQGTLEKDLTLQVARATRDALIETGSHRVLLTRDGDVNLSAADRAAMAQQSNADVFVSIHFNAHADPNVQGTETLVRPIGNMSLEGVDAASRSLANTVQTSLVSHLGLSDRGLKPGYWVVLNERLHNPATARCLVEISFLSNPAEEQRLSNADYIQNAAQALASGINTYLSSVSETPAVGGVGFPQTSAGIQNNNYQSYDPDAYGRSRTLYDAGYGYRVGEFGQVPEGYLFVDIPDMVRGMDVSHYQGNIDWAAVAADGIAFAYIKATEGTTVQDARFAVNWAGARANGVPRGAYHLLKPRSSSSVDTQARNFLDHVNLSHGDMPPALDVEHTDLVKIVDEEGVNDAWRFIYRWCELVQQETNYQVLLYFSKRSADALNFNFGALPSLELWMPRYRSVNRPPPLPLDAANHLVWPHWSFWQHSSTGRVAGISGDVDLNVFNGNAQNFQSWLGNVQPATARGTAFG